jgi:ATP-binding cassette, subfamily B, bacterial
MEHVARGAGEPAAAPLSSDEPEDGQRSLLGIAGFLRASLGQLRPYWKPSALILLTMLPEVALETVQPLLLMTLIDDAILPGNGYLVALIVAALLGLLSIYALGLLANLYLSARVGAGVVNDLRLRVFERLQVLSRSFYARRRTGDLVSRFTSDLDAVDNALVLDLPFATSCLLTITVGTVLMFSIEWRLGLGVLVLLPLVNLGPRFLGARTDRAGYRRQRDVATVVSTLEENIAGQSVITAFGLQRLMHARFRGELDRLFHSTVRVGLLTGLQGATMTAGGHLLLTLAIGAGAFMAVRGEISVGGLVAFFELVWFVMSSVQELAGVVPSLQRAAAGMQRIQELLDERPEIVDAPDAIPLPAFSREIAIQGVSFSHAGPDLHLNGVTATIPARQSVAIVGRSGSGKSTMLSLLMRYSDPCAGSITIDGHDLRRVTQASLRGQIGAVFQESFLFKTTLRDNIRLGKPGATDEEVEAAAKDAEIHDFITSLPAGYDTDVGERGQCLSGGERQRVALARALLRRPAILILDEPASALDAQTEAAINATLARVSRDRTVISVTHRLASVVNAEQILVLESGRLIERGTHEELIRLQGAYSRLWQQQNGAAITSSLEAGCQID